MKQTISFSFPTEGTYEAHLASAYFTLNTWTRKMQYVFDFSLTHKFDDQGIPEKLRKPVKYSRAMQISEDNEHLHKFLKQIKWPDVSAGEDLELETIAGGNEIKLPPELPRLFWVEFSKGTSRAAQFRSITPVISDGVN